MKVDYDLFVLFFFAPVGKAFGRAWPMDGIEEKCTYLVSIVDTCTLQRHPALKWNTIAQLIAYSSSVISKVTDIGLECDHLVFSASLFHCIGRKNHSFNSTLLGCSHPYEFMNLNLKIFDLLGFSPRSILSFALILLYSKYPDNAIWQMLLLIRLIVPEKRKIMK